MLKRVILLLLGALTLEANTITLTDKTLNIVYSTTLRSPLVVDYNVTSLMIRRLSIHKRLSFYKDSRIPKEYQVGSNEYRKSGYDRGHLASDSTFDYNYKVLKRVYTMANIIPMLPVINRKIWLRVEKLERQLALKYRRVRVFNIVRFDKGFKVVKTKYTKGLNIPTGYYKVFIIKNRPMECYYFRNSKPIIYSLSKHKVDCKDVTFGSYLKEMKGLPYE